MTEKPPQRSRAQIKSMSREQIVEAHRRGEFADLLAGNDPGDAAAPLPPRPGQLSRADLKGMSPEAIAAAHDEGRLEDVMAGREPAAPESDPWEAYIAEHPELRPMVEEARAEWEAANAPPPAVGSADLGARGEVQETSQLSRGDLQRMTPAAIVEAHREGRLDRLLRGDHR